jgi:predicted RNA-binding protein with PIN domain
MPPSMGLHYLIDGYNLLFALPDMPPGTWPEKRAQLLSFLEHRRPHGHNALTIVFDSREGLGDKLKQNNLTVIFTAGETADDYISAAVRRASHPRTLVVVSNDQGIRTLVKGTGARFISVEEFLKKSSSASRPRPDERDPGEDQDITDELTQKWL